MREHRLGHYDAVALQNIESVLRSDPHCCTKRISGPDLEMSITELAIDHSEHPLTEPTRRALGNRRRQDALLQAWWKLTMKDLVSHLVSALAWNR